LNSIIRSATLSKKGSKNWIERYTEDKSVGNKTLPTVEIVERTFGMEGWGRGGGGRRREQLLRGMVDR